LKRQESLHHVQLTQILAGDVIPHRKKYQNAASRVLHLVLINEKEKNSLFIFIMFILSNFILQQTKL
jgi:hypothetical protein